MALSRSASTCLRRETIAPPTFVEISPKIASTELRALSRIVTNPRYSWRSINHLSPGQYRPSEGDARVPVKSAKIQTETLPTFLSERHLDELRAKSGICRYARRNPYALRSRFLFALRQPARRPLQDAPSRRDECVLMTRGKGPNRRVKRPGLRGRRNRRRLLSSTPFQSSSGERRFDPSLAPG